MNARSAVCSLHPHLRLALKCSELYEAGQRVLHVFVAYACMEEGCSRGSVFGSNFIREVDEGEAVVIVALRRW